MRRIPADQRRVIVLHHLVDLSVAEVSREIGVPAGTVKSWLSRGRSALAAHRPLWRRSPMSCLPLPVWFSPDSHTSRVTAPQMFSDALREFIVKNNR